MAKILGIDYGKKKVGIAISDELGILARPLSTIQFTSQKDLMEKISGICSNNNVEKIIIGLPITMKGELGDQAKEVADFVERIKNEIGKEVILEDERLTTEMAKKILIREGADFKKNKDILDQLSAKIILQSYLEKNQ